MLGSLGTKPKSEWCDRLDDDERRTYELIRRSYQVDPTAAALPVPYAAWNTFAILLNAEIARLNP